MQNKAGQILFGLYTGMSVNAANKSHGGSSRLWTHTRGIETCLTLHSDKSDNLAQKPHIMAYGTLRYKTSLYFVRDK